MKFKKGMSVAYVLFPIIMLSIALPVFFLSYTSKHANNVKKTLQEASYTGALAGALALDINSFELAEESNPGFPDNYPYDKTTNNPVTFMRQKTQAMRTGNIISTQDILTLNSVTGSKWTGYSLENAAASEAIATAKRYLEEALGNIKDNNGNLVYVDESGKLKEDVFNISVFFERDNLSYKFYKPNGDFDYEKDDPKKSSGIGPYNKITVTVSLKYKPIMYVNAFDSSKDSKESFKTDDTNDVRIPIYGTSSARTKTIL